MTERKIKLWTGFGRYVLAGTGLALAQPAAADAGRLPDARALVQSTAPQLAEAAKPDAKPHKHEGGEQGGEGGEKGIAKDAPPDEAFQLRLLLIKGHLRVGRELLQQGRWNDALPHFLHPSEEIYKDIAPALAERKIAPFEKDLAALVAMVKAKTRRDDVLKGLDALGTKLDAAAGTIAAETRQRPAFTLAVAERLLETAADEYKAAIEKGRIANPVEYQDGRGFVWAAEDFVRAAAPALKAKDAEAYAALEAGFAALKRAWPTVVPGTGAAQAVPEAEVRANISRITLAMSRLR
jgi:hypothetical protein